MKTLLLGAPPLALLAIVTACSSAGSPSTPDPSHPPTVSSSLQRDTAPSVSDADRATLRADNAAFAADFYTTLGASPLYAGKNMFFSPHSISIALAMVYAGANGATATEMASALHFTLPPDRLHPAFDALDLALSSRGADAPPGGDPFTLTVANSLWAAPNMTWVPSFLDTLAVSYGAGVRLTDFQNQPEPSRKLINDWVASETHDKIQDLLGSLDSSTRAVLVNAIYFKAGWASHFEKYATASEVFHGSGAHDANVEMMHKSGDVSYAEGTGWKAVGLPYTGNEVSFIAVLPDDLAAFEASFTGAEAASIVPTPTPQGTVVDLAIPKIEIAGPSISLKDALGARGMVKAFSGAADFSNMTKEAVVISDVVHKAFIATDENGTEAAAATAVVMDSSVTSHEDPPKRIQVTFDKPFVFFIRDNATGAILFLGRYISA